jgi:hypothetical protein
MLAIAPTISLLACTILHLRYSKRSLYPQTLALHTVSDQFSANSSELHTPIARKSGHYTNGMSIIYRRRSSQPGINR